MREKRIRQFVIPVVYSSIVMTFLFSMFLIQKYSNKMIFKDKDIIEDNYVDNEILDNNEYDVPVVNTSTTISRPYLNNEVTIAKRFYDKEASKEEQEDSIVVYDNTYMQNSGVDYVYKDKFDIISILDGTVISVSDDELMGKTVEIRHSNNLISVYQGLSDVNVKENMNVIQGQIIAKSGTSNVNKELGNHLHFELYYGGKIVNPEEYYDKDIEKL